MSFIYKREMTITHADFFRLLPKAIGSTNFCINGQVVKLEQPGFSVQIKLSKELNWHIGALSLPKTYVEISYNNCSEDEALKLIQKFDKTYQKGGG